MVDLNILAPALDVLAKLTQSGLSATIGPHLLAWRARKEKEAELISSESEAATFQALTEAQAQAANNFLERLPENAETVEWISEIENNAFGSQTKKRINNQVKIIGNAAKELENKEVQDHQPDPDWAARFFEYSQDISSEHLQTLWSKILSGEIQNPGQTSLRTLSVLRNLSQYDAIVFENVADYIIGEAFLFFDNTPFNQTQRESDLRYADLIHLQECGLITLSSSTGISISEFKEALPPYHEKHLLIKNKPNSQNEFILPTIPLTSAGRELYKIMKPRIQLKYLQDLSTFLDEREYQLVLLEGVEQLSDGSLTYTREAHVQPRPTQPGTPPS